MGKKLNVKGIIKILALVYVGYALVGQVLSINKIEQQINIKQKEVEVLKEKNRRLQEELNMSDSDVFMEKIARERLGLIKEGEVPIIDQSK